jgi:hypothetical protein
MHRSAATTRPAGLPGLAYPVPVGGYLYRGSRELIDLNAAIMTWRAQAGDGGKRAREAPDLPLHGTLERYAWDKANGCRPCPQCCRVWKNRLWWTTAV